MNEDLWDGIQALQWLANVLACAAGIAVGIGIARLVQTGGTLW